MLRLMRITLEIDEPVLLALDELARREGRSTGAVASDLIRRGLSLAPSGDPASRHGFRSFAALATDERVTSDQVNRLRDDLLI